jgi:hypothetical protein
MRGFGTPSGTCRIDRDFDAMAESLRVIDTEEPGRRRRWPDAGPRPRLPHQATPRAIQGCDAEELRGAARQAHGPRADQTGGDRAAAGHREMSSHLFVFVTSRDLPPTNNGSERASRRRAIGAIRLALPGMPPPTPA